MAKKDTLETILRIWQTGPALGWDAACVTGPGAGRLPHCQLEVTGGTVNVRSGPSLDHKILGEVQQGNVPSDGSGCNPKRLVW